MAAAKKPAAHADSFTLQFEYERDTKNKVVFSEVVDGDWKTEHIIGKMYVTKEQHEIMGAPQNVVITVACA